MYNVFKRPMFKRGGPTQGTGIMSHVEPRKKYANGPSYEEILAGEKIKQPGATLYTNPYIQKQFEQFKSPYFQQGEYDPFSEVEGGLSGSIFYQDPKNRAMYELLKTQPEKAYELFKSGKLPGTTDYNTLQQQQMAAAKKSGIQSLISQFDKDQINKIDSKTSITDKTSAAPKITIPTNADEKQKEIFDMKKEIADETKFLKELLKDEGYDRGQAALILSAAIKEPGTIADKISKAVSLGAPLAAKKKEEEKAITLAAYKLAKEKEQQQIKAGKETDYIRNLRSMAASFVGSPEYKGKTQSEIFKDLLQSKTESSEVRNYLLKSAGKEITRSASEVMEKQKELSKLTPGTKAYDKKKAEIDIISNEIKNLYGSFPEFSQTYPNYGKLFGFKTGGRVMKAEGDLAETETETDIITSNVSFGSPQVKDETVVEKPVEKLSYTQLRDRLPPEITDNVVQLLSTSEEALQDFAYIRTQEDVNAFNVKYGVNLVIPPTKG